MRPSRDDLVKWLRPGLHVKRWLGLLVVGNVVLAVGVAQIIVALYRRHQLPTLLHVITLQFLPIGARLAVAAILGGGAVLLALVQLSRAMIAPFAPQRRGSLVDAMAAHHRRERGLRVAAIGGGTGLPSVLRGLKGITSHITAVVTVADDGGSSGVLRRELGILPPGDLRSNIAALADDEDLMTHLFEYRFSMGGLEGHSFGNLFLTAMSAITGSMDRAVAETGRVLAIEGRVLPATLQEDVTLLAEVQRPGETRLRRVSGESAIPEAGGRIVRVFLQPDEVRAFPAAVRALLAADLIVIGPGSLFTSILPNLLVKGIADALRASGAYKVYVCNVATQPGETDDFSVADHIAALESHIGPGAFDAVLANNSQPTRNKGERTRYVLPDPPDHAIYARYRVELADLTDPARPWRHDPTKLAKALLALYESAPHAAPAQIKRAVQHAEFSPLKR